MLVEGVHWRAGDDPADVAWKLVSVNLSDLAAKGAQPVGLLLGFTLGDDDWDRRFADGLEAVLHHYRTGLLGGDTVGGGGPRHLGMTAIGRATCSPVPSRAGARAGDGLFVTGYLGDASAGFECPDNPRLTMAYSRPSALLAEGALLAPHVHAMMDISDGLLLDANRMADASGLSVHIDLCAIPLSADYIAVRGQDRPARIAAASWGDDYQLLFAGPVETDWPVPATRLGMFVDGDGIRLSDADGPVALPASLGYQHR